MKTLATSTTLEGLTKLINEYFYSIGYKCQESGQIVNHLNHPVVGFKWFKKGKRFYFKLVKNDTV